MIKVKQCDLLKKEKKSKIVLVGRNHKGDVFVVWAKIAKDQDLPIAEAKPAY